jgi:hypothetical protein
MITMRIEHRKRVEVVRARTVDTAIVKFIQALSKLTGKAPLKLIEDSFTIRENGFCQWYAMMAHSEPEGKGEEGRGQSGRA